MHHITHEIAVDVVGVVLIFCEGTVDENLADADCPQVPDHDSQTLDKVQTPSRVPMWMSGRRPANQHGAAQFVKRQLVVARRKVPVLVERRQHLASPDATTRLLNKIVLLDINVNSHHRGNCNSCTLSNPANSR
jgi:hypothetical protein